MKTFEELRKYYENKTDWTIEEIKSFVELKDKLEEDENISFDDIAELDKDGYGDWTLETRDCDSWGGLDSEIEKFYNIETVDRLAQYGDVDFVKFINNDFLAFNLKSFLNCLDEKGYKLSYPDKKVEKK